MTFKVFYDGVEVDLASLRKPPRQRTPFELGFHAAATRQERESNPFPSFTSVSEEWDAGWDLFLNRHKRLRWWDPEVSKPGTSDEQAGVTFACFGQDLDGYFLLKPCCYRWVSLAGGIWTAYDRSAIRVIECAHYPMKNPASVNFMHPDFDWDNPDVSSGA